MSAKAFFCSRCDAFIAPHGEATAPRGGASGSLKTAPSRGLHSTPTAGPLAPIEALTGGPSAPAYGNTNGRANGNANTNGSATLLPSTARNIPPGHRPTRRVWRGFGELVAILAATTLFAAGTVAVRYMTEKSDQEAAVAAATLKRLGLTRAQWTTGACVHGDPVGFPGGDTGGSSSQLVAVLCSPPFTPVRIVMQVPPGSPCSKESGIVLAHNGRQYCATRAAAKPEHQA